MGNTNQQELPIIFTTHQPMQSYTSNTQQPSVATQQPMVATQYVGNLSIGKKIGYVVSTYNKIVISLLFLICNIILTLHIRAVRKNIEKIVTSLNVLTKTKATHT